LNRRFETGAVSDSLSATKMHKLLLVDLKHIINAQKIDERHYSASFLKVDSSFHEGISCCAEDLQHRFFNDNGDAISIFRVAEGNPDSERAELPGELSKT